MLNVIHAVHNEKAGLDVLLHLIDVLIALSLKLAEALFLFSVLFSSY